MCGKYNPLDVEVCRYCQARLKPLNVSTGSSAPGAGKTLPPASTPPASPPPANPPPASPAPAGQENNDWLRGLLDTPGSGEPAESSAERPTEPVDDTESADWLARIRQRKTEEQDELSKIGPKPLPSTENSSDWSGGQESGSTANASDVSAWLESLRDSDAPQTPAQPPRTVGSPPASAGRTPAAGPTRKVEPEKDDDDWLRSLTTRIQASQSLDEGLLKPKTSQPDSGSKPPADLPPAQPAAADDLPDWLNDLQPVQPEKTSPAQPPASTSQTGGSLDWLRNLGSVPPEPAAEPGDVPDWLKDLQPSTGEPAQPTAAATPAEEIPDWLRDLQAEQPSMQGKTAAPAEPAAEANEELPDWLNSLQAEQPTPDARVSQPPVEAAPADTTLTGVQGAAATPADEIPDWLHDFQIEQPPAAAAPAPANETSDWLSGLQATQPPAAEQSPAEPAAEMPDWLSELRSEPPAADEPMPDWQSGSGATELPAAAPAVADETPDWLRGLQSGQPPAAEQPAASAEEPAAAAPPDWQSQFGAPLSDATAPTGAAPAPEPASPAGETPGWLSELGAPAPDEPAATAADQPPGWMKGFQAAGETSTAPAKEPPTGSAAIPDWLSDFRGIPAATAAGLPPTEGSEQPPAAPSAPAPLSERGRGAAEAQPTPAAETPDWLREFENAPAESLAPRVESAAPGDSVRDWLNSLNTAETPPPPTPALEGSAEEELAPAEIPDWLQAMRNQPPTPPLQPIQPAEPLGTSASPFGQENLPDWMNAPQPADSGWGTPETLPTSKVPAASSEMGDLLASVTAEQEANREAGTEPLEPAQLPNWLQAMRPVESDVSDIPTSSAADDQRVEKSGPLAGLRGVLPGEEMVSQYRKPPVYTNKLQVSEKQHLHASMLEGILAEETQVQPVTGESAQASQLIIRLLVALLLIALVLTPALTGFSLTVPSGLADTQPGLTAAYRTINNLPGGANVLLAADFEAGLSGELKAAARPLLSQLQSHQPRVIIASTVPAGPVLGEMLLSTANVSPLANLGYLAGGTNALKMLAAHASDANPTPLQQVVPFPYIRGWNDPAMQGMKDITSFQVIIVVTDSLENARNWVEQVQPGLGPQTQLILISSAQVAPLVRTYLQNGQVQGVVSGLAGGTAYEQITQQPGLATSSWTAYQLTLAAVVLLIVAGALASGISSLFGRGKSKRKA